MVVGYWSLLLHLNLEGKYMLLDLNLFRMFMYVGARPLYLSNFNLFCRFYYNKKTKVSSWEKPFELMTPIEVSHAIDFVVVLLNDLLVI